MIFWLLYIASEALIQNRLITEKGWKPVYFQLFIIRGMASISHGILLDMQYDMEQYLTLLIFQISSFWILFDILLNKLRDLPFFYKGKTSGWLDKIPNPYYLILKGIVLIVAVLSYINGLQYWKL